MNEKDSFLQQKDLMAEQLKRLEEMDKILPLHKEQVQAEKQIKIKLNSLNFKRMMSGKTDEQLMEEIEETKHGSNRSRQEALKRYYQPFLESQSDVNDFNQKDFELLEQLKEKQRQIAEQDLSVAKQKERSASIFEENLMRKWDRVRKKLRMLGRMKRIYDEVKLYGTSCRVETSIKRHEVISELEQMLNKQHEQINKVVVRVQTHLFYPDSRLKYYWSFILIFLLLYTSFITPVRMSFVDEPDSVWFAFELIVDFLFLIDILITLNSAYYNDEGTLITSRSSIVLNYIKSWFFFDLLAIFPADFITNESYSNFSNYFKLTRLPRLYKLITITRSMALVQKAHSADWMETVQDILNLNSTTVRILKFFVTVIICVHIMGCLWYLVAKIYDFGPETWVYELGLTSLSKYELYLASIYWAVATICTVGFGDIHAFNDTERIVCIFWMFFGVGFYSFTVGSLSALVGDLDTRQSHLQTKITFMDEFCEETKLSIAMKHKIRKVLEYNSLINIFSSQEVDDFLSDIPTHLKFQIAQAMFTNLRNRVSFFKNKDSVFISTLIPKLQPLRVASGEFIYNKGEYPNQVYFVVNGRVNMVIGVYSITFKTYVTGSYFGEIEIFDNSARFHSARAETECELLSIEQYVFKKILQQFPDYNEEIKKTSLEKLIREREAIEKLQDLTGLSQTSEFFRKKRVQSIYKSIKQRSSIHFVDASFETDQDLRHSRLHTYCRKKTNQIIDDSIRFEEFLSAKKLQSSLPKIIEPNSKDSEDQPIRREARSAGHNPSIILTNEDDDSEHLKPVPLKMETLSPMSAFDGPKNRFLSHMSPSNLETLQLKENMPSEHSEQPDSPKTNFVPPKLTKQSFFHPKKTIKDFQENLKLKNLPQQGSYRRTYRKEIEVVEEHVENDDLTQLQQKLEDLLQKLKKQKALARSGNKPIQYNFTKPRPDKIAFKDDEKDSLFGETVPQGEQTPQSRASSPFI